MVRRAARHGSAGPYTERRRTTNRNGDRIVPALVKTRRTAEARRQLVRLVEVNRQGLEAEWEFNEMMVTCQFSLYPLRTERIGTILEEALEEVEALGLNYKVSTMSTEVQGSEEEVFAALRAAYARAAEHGEVVLVATVSNAC